MHFSARRRVGGGAADKQMLQGGDERHSHHNRCQFQGILPQIAGTPHEVVVFDDASEDATAGIVAGQYPGVRLIAEPRRIVREHNGSIRVQSEVGKGTRFVISLPLAGPKQ